jgi:predicted peptidase
LQIIIKNNYFCTQKTEIELLLFIMKMLFRTPLIVIMVLTYSCQSQERELFQKHSYEGEKGQLPYRLHVPDIENGRTYPLILYFHGAGERGTDNEISLKNGVLNFVSDYNLINNPCFILVPQCKKHYRWVETDWNAPSHAQPNEMSVPMRATIELLYEIIKNYPIDTDRLYVTGLSMGGFATWDIISRFPDMFAAAIAVCGGGDETTAERISHIPIWAFHGSNDKVVLPFRTVNMVDAIRKNGGNAILTIYEGMEHNVWSNTYSNQEVIDWLFRQRKHTNE